MSERRFSNVEEIASQTGQKRVIRVRRVVRRLQSGDRAGELSIAVGNRGQVLV
jgi:hypothetical protein